MVDDGFGKHQVVVLVIPVEHHRVGVVGVDKAVRGLHFGNCIGTQRQCDGDFALRAIVGHFQEIIGGSCSRGAEPDFVHLSIFGSSNGGNKVTVCIPERALIVRRGNITLRVDLIGGIGKIVGLVHELPVFIPGQHVADFADLDLPKSFVVIVVFGDDIVIHAIGAAAADLIHAVRGQFKYNIVLAVIEIPARTFDLNNAVLAQRQFLRGLHFTVGVGIESAGLCPGIAGFRVVHLHKGFTAVLGNIVKVERGVDNFYRLASFNVDFDKLQVTLQLFVQNVVGHVAAAGRCDTAGRHSKAALRAGRIDSDKERFSLKNIFRYGGFHDDVLAVGEPLHTQDAFFVRKDFGQAVFLRVVGRNPAKALPVGKIAVCGQGGIIAGNRGGVALVHRGNSLFFVRKIKFQRVLIVAGFTVGFQNAGGIVAAIGIFGELVSLAQQRYTVHLEPGTAQLDGGRGLPGGGHQLLQAEPGFQHFILRLVFGADNVSGFICISKGLIVVDFITEIAFCKGEVVAVIGLAAVQGAALGNSRILIAVDIVGIFRTAAGEGGIAAGRLQLFIEKRILAGEVILPVGIHRDHDAGGALHKVVTT